MNKENLLAKTEKEAAKVKLNNGFDVSEFIVKSGVDFVYAKNNGEFTLLNLDTLGVTPESVICGLVEGEDSVAIISGLDMEVYNMSESTLKNAMINM